uniref:Uncharacterized protein n=1 Tax=Pseudopediastrum boryanum TaxID=55410 RepID=A0A2U8GK07_PSEBY|nr:hypothetical protein [Pseudopediastrum boryanum]AWI68640.1 hypothetical protein [Pseudopediastrum boryanum]
MQFSLHTAFIRVLLEIKTILICVCVLLFFLLLASSAFVFLRSTNRLLLFLWLLLAQKLCLRKSKSYACARAKAMLAQEQKLCLRKSKSYACARAKAMLAQEQKLCTFALRRSGALRRRAKAMHLRFAKERSASYKCYFSPFACFHFSLHLASVFSFFAEEGSNIVHYKKA